jgi:hypothetical protein
MRFGATALSLATLMAMIALTGCGGDNKGGGGGDDEKKDVPPLKPKKPVTYSTCVVKGKVTFDGDIKDLKLEEKTKAVVKQINEKRDNLKVCFDEAPADQKDQQTWRVHPETKGVANVVVFLKPKKDTFFALDEDHPAVKLAKKQKLFLDQPHCAFLPHTLVVFPSYLDKERKSVKTGQEFTVHNSASIPHNTNLSNSKNKQNPLIKAGDKVEFDLKPSAEPISVACNIHSWMRGTIWALDHPYAAVTKGGTQHKGPGGEMPEEVKKEDFGTFEIKDAPEGEVEIAVWHEGVSGNWIQKGKTIKLSKDRPLEIDFKITKDQVE